MRRALALLLALAACGCGTQTLNTRDDVSEMLRSLAGQPTTLKDRLVRIWEAHDRRDAASWPLVRDAEGGVSSLRIVLRDLEKIEETPFENVGMRLRTILFLLDVAAKSESALVRIRANLTLARIGDAIPSDSGPGPKAVSEERLTLLYERIKQADAGLPGKDRPETEELRRSRRAALEDLSLLRWWPPVALDRPPAARQDELERGAKWARTTLEYPYRADRFAMDFADPEFGPAEEQRLAGLGAEVVRYALARALLRDPEVSVRYDAVGALEEVGTGDLVAVLAAASATDTSEWIRLRAAQGIGKLGRLDLDVAVPALAALLGDLDDDVRHAAHGALRDLTGEDQGERSDAWITWWSTRAAGGVGG